MGFFCLRSMRKTPVKNIRYFWIGKWKQVKIDILHSLYFCCGICFFIYNLANSVKDTDKVFEYTNVPDTDIVGVHGIVCVLLL